MTDEAANLARLSAAADMDPATASDRQWTDLYVAVLNTLELIRSGRLVLLPSVPYEELSIMHGQQVTVTFKKSADAVAFFNHLKGTGDADAV